MKTWTKGVLENSVGSARPAWAAALRHAWREKKCRKPGPKARKFCQSRRCSMTTNSPPTLRMRATSLNSLTRSACRAQFVCGEDAEGGVEGFGFKVEIVGACVGGGERGVAAAAGLMDGGLGHHLGIEDVDDLAGRIGEEGGKQRAGLVEAAMDVDPALRCLCEGAREPGQIVKREAIVDIVRDEQRREGPEDCRRDEGEACDAQQRLEVRQGRKRRRDAINVTM